MRFWNGLLPGRYRGLFLLLVVLGLGVALLTCLPFDNAGFEPTGTPFYLKATVRMAKLAGSRTGYNPTGLFSMDFSGQSLTADTASDTLPAGLVLRSLTRPVQHMIIAKDQPLVVPAGHDTLITIGTFCCNEGRTPPTDTDYFELGPITDNTELQQIYSITRFKRLNSSNVLTVQNAIWAVTDGDGLTQVLLDSLNNLPNDTTWGASPGILRVEPGFFQLQKQRARASFHR